MASSNATTAASMPKPGDSVSITLHSKETLRGVVEWVDGNGAWVKGEQKSRWIPIEYFLWPELVNPPRSSEAEERGSKRRKEESEEE